MNTTDMNEMKEANLMPAADEYVLRKENIALCELEVLRRGICSSLVPGGIYFDGELIHIVPEVSGLIPLSSLVSEGFASDFLPGEPCLKKGRPMAALQIFRRWLASLRSIIEGLSELEEYLISERSVSLDPAEIFFHPPSESVKFLMKPREEDWLTSVLALCERVGEVWEGTEGGLVASKLRKENENGILDFNKALRLLSSWEMEY